MLLLLWLISRQTSLKPAMRLCSSLFTVVAVMATGLAPLQVSAQGLEAKIQKQSDGSAKVIFQPVAPNDRVDVYTANGLVIGRLDWAALFEVSVSEATLKEATVAGGIDIRKLLAKIGLKKIEKSNYVAAELPFAVQSTGKPPVEIAAGSVVYFKLDQLALDGIVAPVGAYGGNATIANEFNDKLLEKGVTGAKPREIKRGKHAHGARVPLNSKSKYEGPVPADQKFLSAPLCTERNDRFSMTSYYGPRPVFKTTNGQTSTSFHDGLDIAGVKGSPVVAAADGCVTRKLTNRGSGYGLTVYLDHGNGVVTQYSHMNSFASGLAAPMCFKRGDQLGTVGATGNCTGNHLHFGVYKNGKSVNPRQYMVAQSNADLSMTCTQLQASNAVRFPDPNEEPARASNAPSAVAAATNTAGSGNRQNLTR